MTFKKLTRLTVFLFIMALLHNPVFADIRLGVLAHRGFEATVTTWTPTAELLERKLRQKVSIIPLGFEEVVPAVASEKIDFLVANPMIYVNLAHTYGAVAIATVEQTLSNGMTTNQFGSVLFTRSDSSINEYKDLKAKHLCAVAHDSFGGWLIIKGSLLAKDFDIESITKHVSFLETHDEVVRSVIEGRCEAGIVRTGIIEGMAQNGSVDQKRLKLINSSSSTHRFPQMISSELFPEWPFIKMKNTSLSLSKSVVTELLQLSETDFIRPTSVNLWTVPANYQNVDDLLRTLRYKPYDRVLLGQWLELLRSKESLQVFLILSLLGLVSFVFLFQIKKKTLKGLYHQIDLVSGKFESLFKGTNEGILFVRDDGHIQEFNPQALTLLERAGEDLIDRSIAEYFPKEIVSELGRIGPKTGRHFIHEVTILTKTRKRIVDVVIHSRQTESGSGRILFLRDITDMIALHREKVASTRRAFETDKITSLGVLGAGLALEINNPLTIIAGTAKVFIAIVERGKQLAPEKILKLSNELLRATDRISLMIKSLRLLGKKKEEAPEEMVCIGEIVSGVMSILEQRIKKEAVTFDLQLSEEIKVLKILCSPAELFQVFTNIVMNALDAVKEYETREVVWQIKTDGVLISSKVTDSGRGVAPERKDTLFTGQDTEGGTGKSGLSLSYCGRVAKSYHGKIFLDATSPRTCFIFQIPIDYRSYEP